METWPSPFGPRRAARTRAIALLSTIALCGAAILGLPWAIDRRDPYSAAVEGSVPAWAAGLPVRDQVAMKTAHALAHEPFDIGLFGNSRLVAVGADEVEAGGAGPIGGSLFNFAVGGTSFLQSVRTFRYLAEHGRAPRIAVVSIDHFAIGFFGYRYWPSPLWDVGTMVGDGMAAARLGSGALDAAVRAGRVAAAEVRAGWREFQREWSADMVDLRLRSLAGWDTGSVAYRGDGSIDAPEDVFPIGNADIAVAAPQWPAHQRDLLLAALGQLADAATEAGATAIVFESPVHSSFLSALGEADRQAIETVRAAFFAECAALGLTCVAAPQLAEDDPAARWADCCHAPARLLGSFVATLVRRAGR